MKNSNNKKRTAISAGEFSFKLCVNENKAEQGGKVCPTELTPRLSRLLARRIHRFNFGTTNNKYGLSWKQGIRYRTD